MIEKARENMHARHPKTRFVNAHMAMLYYDMDKVAALLDKYPNADVELSATVQDLGRAPLMIRKFFMKYQDRIVFGSDGNPGRGVEEFWVPHWRFLETYDEVLRSPRAAPLFDRRSAARPLENLRRRPARRRAAEGVRLRERLAISAVGSRFDREAVGRTAMNEKPREE